MVIRNIIEDSNVYSDPLKSEYSIKTKHLTNSNESERLCMRLTVFATLSKDKEHTRKKSDSNIIPFFVFQLKRIFLFRYQ